jgi:hypothetical protein
MVLIYIALPNKNTGNIFDKDKFLEKKHYLTLY